VRARLRRICAQGDDRARFGHSEPARAKLLDEQAEWARLKNARLRGAVLDSEAVKAEWSALLTRLRGRLLAIPSRMPALSRADFESLDAELRAALGELADGAEDEEKSSPKTGLDHAPS